MFVMCAMLAGAPPLRPEAAVAFELGVPGLAGLPETLQAKYEEDDVTAQHVQQSPAKYPLRATVLDVAAVMRESYRLKPVEQIFELKLEFAKKDVLNFQEDLASSILLLREATESLETAAKQRSVEPSARWQAHLDYLMAATKHRAGTLEELNLAYGTVHRNELPPVKSPNTGWKIEAIEKMNSKRDVRRMLEESLAEFEDVAKTNPGTPWARLAERELTAKPGLGWVAAEVKPPPPPLKPTIKKKKD